MSIPKVVFSRDRRGEWRWSVKSRNGRKCATPGEGFKTRRGCERNLILVAKALRPWAA